MTISAKFATVCPCCNNRINVGDKVEWAKGSKARHVSCAGKPAAVSAPSAVKSAYRRARGARYCEGWGADNPHKPCAPYTCTQCGNDD